MLAQRRGRWANMKTTLFQRLVLFGLALLVLFVRSNNVYALGGTTSMLQMGRICVFIRHRECMCIHYGQQQAVQYGRLNDNRQYAYASPETRIVRLEYKIL